MSQNDRETVVVSNDRGGSGAGWLIAGLIIAALLLGGFFLMGGIPSRSDGGSSTSIEMNVPDAPAENSAPAASGDAAPADTGEASN